MDYRFVYYYPGEKVSTVGVIMGIVLFPFAILGLIFGFIFIALKFPFKLLANILNDF